MIDIKELNDTGELVWVLARYIGGYGEEPAWESPRVCWFQPNRDKTHPESAAVWFYGRALKKWPRAYHMANFFEFFEVITEERAIEMQRAWVEADYIAYLHEEAARLGFKLVKIEKGSSDV